MHQLNLNTHVENLMLLLPSSTGAVEGSSSAGGLVTTVGLSFSPEVSNVHVQIQEAWLLCNYTQFPNAV